MTLAALLGELRHRSVLLDPRGDDLRCLAPKGALTPELRRSIAENKPAILSLLGALGGNGRLKTSTAASTNLCLHRLFEAQARRTPDAVAVVCDGEHVSYGELQRRAARLAHVLRTSGLRQETTVAIQQTVTVDALVAVLAVLGAGGASVPIDPEEPPESVSDHADLAFSLVEKNRAANFVAESTTEPEGSTWRTFFPPREPVERESGYSWSIVSSPTSRPSSPGSSASGRWTSFLPMHRSPRTEPLFRCGWPSQPGHVWLLRAPSRSFATPLGWPRISRAVGRRSFSRHRPGGVVFCQRGGAVEGVSVPSRAARSSIRR
jgi:hypothetical protein